VVALLVELSVVFYCSVRKDMDEKEGRLIGAHYYCTQEFVNLLLTGRASSNVFNGKRELGDGEDKMTLRGIKQRGNIGLLTLYEHYRSCEVRYLSCAVGTVLLYLSSFCSLRGCNLI
jgi:hypothetical protein